MKEVYTKEESRSLKVGISVALVVLAIIAYNSLSANKVEHAEKGTYYALQARFGRTDGLQIGDKVRLAGMTVGRVVNAQLDNNFNALMRLEIKDSVKIPTDSSAAIVSSGIMGNKYIEIEPGGDEEYMQAGDEFSYTQDAMVLEELVDRIISIGKANRTPAQNNDVENLKQKIEE